MSSFESAPKKRCIIQKLDFENCIVTSIKTKSRARKKLRARITREIEHIDDTPCVESESFITKQNTPPLEMPPSPVLTTPVFFKKNKPSQKEDECESSTEDVCSPLSPVFKLKPNKYTCLSKSQDIQQRSRRTASSDLFSQGSSTSCGHSSYQIEDFTQESKQSIKISSVDSTEIINKSTDYSVDSKSDSSKCLNISWQKDEPDPLSKWLERRELRDKNVRKSYKKNSLLGRLQKLLQKQASEKLLWQHQNRGNSSCSLKFVVVEFWRVDFNFILKCRSTDPEWNVTFLIVDTRWVPNVRKIQEGCVLQLYPPWQKICPQNTTLTVLLNIICLDVLDKSEQIQEKNMRLVPVPTTEYETNPTLFINSLFSYSFTELLM